MHYPSILQIVFLILLGLLIFFSLGFLFYKNGILFFLYGLDLNLIKSDTADSYAAFKKITLGKKIFLWLVFLLTLVDFLLAYYLLNNNMYLINYRVTVVIMWLIVILLLFYSIGIVLAFLSPNRIM